MHRPTAEDVDELLRPFDLVAVTDFFHSHDLRLVAHPWWLVDEDLIADQLPEIFIRGHHKYFKAI